MRHKYVIDELENFMIFSENVQHISAGRILTDVNHTKIIGAGFVSLENGEVHCYGKSASLGIESRGSFDDEVIADSLVLDIME